MTVVHGYHLSIPDAIYLSAHSPVISLKSCLMSFFILFNTPLFPILLLHYQQVPRYKILLSSVSSRSILAWIFLHIFSSFLLAPFLGYFFSPQYVMKPSVFQVASNLFFYLIFKLLLIVQHCDPTNNTFLFFSINRSYAIILKSLWFFFLKLINIRTHTAGRYL